MSMRRMWAVHNIITLCIVYCVYMYNVYTCFLARRRVLAKLRSFNSCVEQDLNEQRTKLERYIHVHVHVYVHVPSYMYFHMYNQQSGCVAGVVVHLSCFIVPLHRLNISTSHYH